MDTERRRFLKQLAALCGAGVARSLGAGAAIGTVAVAATATPAAVAATTAVLSPYGAGVRKQVFEVIVRQAQAGAPWQEICKGPMAVNSISETEVIAEVAKRKLLGHTDKPGCNCDKCLVQRMDTFKQYQNKCDAIAHSTMSPCACKDCRVAIEKVMDKIRVEVYRPQAKT